MRIDTHNIANLARISLTEDEHVSFNKDIESILTFIDTIQSQSVSGETKDSSLGFAPVGITRADAVVAREGEYSPVEIIKQAPASLNNAVKVKKILN